uniref:Glycosyl transferase family 2 n=1 Tax=Geobacter sp. (strain M21) TaxID=443144 RepID=C6E0L2_GEOSM
MTSADQTTTLISLDPAYSTTRLVTQVNPGYNIVPDAKFDTVVSECESRRGEGGLRTKGYFKQSFICKPLVTVITVVFNGQKHIEETIQSVICQTYDNVEYIIIDGGSTDGTVDLIRKYREQIDYWVSEDDEGIYDAMNKGIKLAQGTWIALLNSDDYYVDKDALYTLSEVGEIYDVAVSDVIILTAHSKKLFAVDYRRPSYLNIPYMHTGMFFRKKAYYEAGYYDIRYKIASDIEYVFRHKSLGSNIIKLSLPLVCMRDDGASSRMFKIGRREYRQIYIKYGGSLLLGWYGYFYSRTEKWAYNSLVIREGWRILKRILAK